MSKKIFIITITALFLLPSLAAAQMQNNPGATNFGLDSNFSRIGIANRGDLQGTIASIINIVLGLLGMMAVIIILYAGFKWMTAAGNEDQVREAQKMLAQAVVGLLIIFAAWAIASYAINALKNATGVDSTGVPNQTISPPAGGNASLPAGSGNASLPVGGGLLTNPGPAVNNNLDSDGDGLTDWEETNVYHTDPHNPDTDGDGFSDGTEANNGFNPSGAGKIIDPNNTNSCSSFFSLLAGALNDPSKLADAQKQIKDCCAQKQDPLCSGF